MIIQKASGTSDINVRHCICLLAVFALIASPALAQWENGTGHLLESTGLNQPGQQAVVFPYVLSSAGWKRLELPNRPDGRGFSAGVYLPESGELLVHAGAGEDFEVYVDSWLFDGQTWARVENSNLGISAGFGMVYDPQREEVVLFGGSTTESVTWVFDGLQWEKGAVSGPPPMMHPRMFYHPNRSEIIVAGGYSEEGAVSEIWSWDGQSWRIIAKPPVALSDGWVATFIPGTTHILLYNPQLRFTDVAFQIFDGKRWKTHKAQYVGQLEYPVLLSWPGMKSIEAVAPSGSGTAISHAYEKTVWRLGLNALQSQPPKLFKKVRTRGEAPSGSGKMVYDRYRDCFVHFDGSVVRELHGRQWVAVERPGPGNQFVRSNGKRGTHNGRRLYSMVYDETNKRTLVTGGYIEARSPTRGTVLRDIWSWDGSAWKPLPEALPDRNAGSAAVYLPTTGQVLIAGGYNIYSHAGTKRVVHNRHLLLVDGDRITSAVSTANIPEGRAPFIGVEPGLVFNAYNETVSLFGGYYLNAYEQKPVTGLMQVGTSAPDGWTSTHSAFGPCYLRGFSINGDPASGRAVLFGGIQQGDQRFYLPFWNTDRSTATVWVWNGSIWRPAASNNSPDARYGHATAWNPGKRAILIAGGMNESGPLNDVWLLKAGRIAQ